MRPRAMCWPETSSSLSTPGLMPELPLLALGDPAASLASPPATPRSGPGWSQSGRWHCTGWLASPARRQGTLGSHRRWLAGGDALPPRQDVAPLALPLRPGGRLRRLPHRGGRHGVAWPIWPALPQPGRRQPWRRRSWLATSAWCAPRPTGRPLLAGGALAVGHTPTALRDDHRPMILAGLAATALLGSGAGEGDGSRGSGVRPGPGPRSGQGPSRWTQNGPWPPWPSC